MRVQLGAVQRGWISDHGYPPSFGVVLQGPAPLTFTVHTEAEARTLLARLEQELPPRLHEYISQALRLGQITGVYMHKHQHDLTAINLELGHEEGEFDSLLRTAVAGLADFAGLETIVASTMNHEELREIIARAFTRLIV